MDEPVEAGESTDRLLRAIVGVEVVDADTARGRTDFSGDGDPPDEGRGLFGGLMISQALASCAHTVPAGSIPDSIHANLLSGGRRGDPTEFRVERVRDGGALQHRNVVGFQNGSPIVHACVVSALPAEGADWQSAPAPEVPPPHLEPGAPSPWANHLGWGAFEVAHPDYSTDHPPWVPLWIRSAVGDPRDPWVHAAVLAFWSDYGLNGAARQTQATLEDAALTLSASHSVWIHRRSDLTEWHLLDAHTRTVAGNQALVQAALYDSGGRLIASIAQGVFIRRPRPAKPPGGA